MPFLQSRDDSRPGRRRFSLRKAARAMSSQIRCRCRKWHDSRTGSIASSRAHHAAVVSSGRRKKGSSIMAADEIGVGNNPHAVILARTTLHGMPLGPAAAIGLHRGGLHVVFPTLRRVFALFQSAGRLFGRLNFGNVGSPFVRDQYHEKHN